LQFSLQAASPETFWIRPRTRENEVNNAKARSEDVDCIELTQNKFQLWI